MDGTTREPWVAAWPSAQHGHMGSGEVQVRLGWVHHLQVPLLVHHPDLLHHQRGAPCRSGTWSRLGVRAVSTDGVRLGVREGTFLSVFQSVLVDFCHFLQMKNIFLIQREKPTQGSHGKGPWLGHQSCGASDLVGGMRGGGAGLAHQDECVHDIFANLQAGGARHFQKQITCGFLNLKKKMGRFQERTKLSQADAISSDVSSAENPLWHMDPDVAPPRGTAHTVSRGRPRTPAAT